MNIIINLKNISFLLTLIFSFTLKAQPFKLTVDEMKVVKEYFLKDIKCNKILKNLDRFDLFEGFDKWASESNSDWSIKTVLMTDLRLLKEYRESIDIYNKVLESSKENTIIDKDFEGKIIKEIGLKKFEKNRDKIIQAIGSIYFENGEKFLKKKLSDVQYIENRFSLYRISFLSELIKYVESIKPKKKDEIIHDLKIIQSVFYKTRPFSNNFIIAKYENNQTTSRKMVTKTTLNFLEKELSMTGKNFDFFELEKRLRKLGK